MRYADIRFVAPANPLFEDQQLLADIRPLPRDQRIENETYGGSLDFQPTSWWRQTLVVGIDRHAGAIPPQREPATVADALLGATRERVSKSSLRYSTSFSAVSSTSGSGGTLTLGVENARLLRERLGLQVDIQGVGRGLAALYADEVNNRGVFGQLKLSFARTLFVTGGLRGEDNDTFGERYGTAWSPMIGGAFTRDVGPSTMKFRLAYGKGIRAPAPSMRRQISTFAFRQLANPNLEPETQSGVEGGVELYLGDRASIALTRYNQFAEGLIQQVVPERDTGDEDSPAIQYQNVGRIQNSGWELEGTGRLGSLRADLTFSVTDSRVRALSPNYTGHLSVGDRVPEVPSSSGLASLTFERWRTQLTLGASYIGSWRGYDWKRFYEQLGASDATPTLGAYLTRYKALTKPYVSLTQDVWKGVDWFVRVDNLTNVQRNERDNVQITPGRTATLGVRIGR
jgi:outer membrane receptor protein involved in Fe transport